MLAANDNIKFLYSFSLNYIAELFIVIFYLLK